MEYVLTIEKREPNPEYKPQQMFNRSEIPPFIERKEMYVALTEAEFQAVKKAVLEVM